MTATSKKNVLAVSEIFNLVFSAVSFDKKLRTTTLRQVTFSEEHNCYHHEFLHTLRACLWSAFPKVAGGPYLKSQNCNGIIMSLIENKRKLPASSFPSLFFCGKDNNFFVKKEEKATWKLERERKRKREQRWWLWWRESDVWGALFSCRSAAKDQNLVLCPESVIKMWWEWCYYSFELPPCVLVCVAAFSNNHIYITI